MKYYINRETEKISALSSEKIDKYKYLKGEKTFRFNSLSIMGL